MIDDILMPIVSSVFGTPEFSNLFIILRNPAGEAFTPIEAAREVGAVVLNYGLFLNALIAFLIVALVLFFVVKGMNRLQRKKEAEVVVEPAQEKLLAEIRDLLKVQTARA